MSIAIVPNRIRTNTLLDDADINENWQALGRGCRRNNDARYTYSTAVIDLAGLDSGATGTLRTIPIKMQGFWGATPATFDYAEVVGVELCVYAAAATWTATIGNGTKSISLSATSTGATVEAYNSSNAAFKWGAAETLSVVVSGSTGTITNGKLILHWRTDRQIQQSAARVDYVPTLFDASTATTNTVWNNELAAAAASTAADFANDRDLRIEIFVARALSSTLTWRIPSGAGAVLTGFGCGVVGTAGEAVTVTVGASAVPLTATGTGSVVTGQGTGATFATDPTDSADDCVLSMAPTSGTPDLVFCALYWR
jgi:hypothetical protein